MISRLLENDGLNGAKIASNTNYEGSVIIAYYLKSKYYGTPKPRMPEDDLVEELKRNGINYYFVWDAAKVENAALKITKEWRAEDRSLSVYSVKY
ncbi:MAG TPA: hypothetical protein VIV66_08625 [Pyrinomonadaceae bacterium]